MSDLLLPYGRQTVDESDIAAVVDVLRSDYLTTGPAVGRFEAMLAGQVGARHAVACSSGTAALHLAVLAAGLGPGDTVIVPAMTFVATANAARLAGAEVLFADVAADTGLMGKSELRSALARAGAARVKAVIPVHYAGQCVDPAAIAGVATEHDLVVIEDAAHAIGTRFGERTVGACGHSAMACFSFHPIKTITTGEGGAVTTNDDDMAELLRRYRNHGITRLAESFIDSNLGLATNGLANPWYYEAHEIGLNYRVSDLSCALGTSQLAKLEHFVIRRAELVARYDERLADFAPLVRPLARVAACQPGWHLYVVRIDFDRIGTSRAEIMTALRQRGVGSQVHYIPVPLHPTYREGADDLPGAAAFYAQALSLPLYPAMVDADVDRVVLALAETLGQ